MAKILIANGVNLDLLGQREPEIYGSLTLAELESAVRAFTKKIAPLIAATKTTVHFFQSNDEAVFLNEISKSWDGIVMNPGAWSHTSLALADRLRALQTPYVEVHLSNLAAREEFRHFSYAAAHAKGVVFGFGLASYYAGIVGLLTGISCLEIDRPPTP